MSAWISPPCWCGGSMRGEAFDLAKFHEEVLSHGTLPVKYLPELVK